MPGAVSDTATQPPEADNSSDTTPKIEPSDDVSPPTTTTDSTALAPNADTVPQIESTSTTSTLSSDSTDDTPLPLSPPTPILPPGIADHILRPYSSDDSQCGIGSDTPVISIPDSILEEVNAMIAYSLSLTAQERAIEGTEKRLDEEASDRIHEPLVHLCYPYEHCHDVIDTALKTVAQRQKADLVTIDMLELALMEYGPFGEKTAETVQNLYSGRYYRSGQDESIQDVFDALVQIQSEDLPSNDSSTYDRRIVYIKDFATIILFGNRILGRMLRAIHKRRSNKAVEGTPLLPTILVLGYAKAYGTDSETLEAFANGGNHLRMLVGKPYDKMHGAPGGFKPFPGPFKTSFLPSYFLKSVLSKTEETDLEIMSISNYEEINVDHLQLSAGAFLSLYSQGGDDQEKNREAELQIASRRRCDILDAWMRLCLAHCGAEGPEHPIYFVNSTVSPPVAETERTVDIGGQLSYET
ncbi:hypothetical protein BDQ17DRAFT_628953 [Cyathus striatus]|nr:hypothetical protein BDQ17DRAFT_628953 [Cyathus striatus]